MNKTEQEMIQANELRIGNWLQFFNLLEPKKYIQINARFFSSLAGGRSAEEMRFDEQINNYYSGIPITSTLLEKSGFVYENMGDEPPYEQWVFGDYRQFELWNYNNKHWILDMADQKTIDQSHFKYVHQLQNLYFALTQTELEIKL